MTEAPGAAGPHGGAHPRYAPGTPCWVSLMVRELTAAQDFYGALFGWEFRPGPQQLGPYVRALLDGRPVAGLGQAPADRRLPVAWTPYLASDRVDTTAETVRLCGGTIGVGPLDAAEAGRLALGSDPSGALFGIWEAADHPGFGVTGVPGAPAWHELVTGTSAGVVRFYETVFGHAGEADGAPGVDHVTLRVGGRPVAGVRGAGDALLVERGAHWTTYFEVADPDVAHARVTELGGRALGAVHDGPHGRVVEAADPEGARFTLVRRPH
ncbi:VOC family protein [Streptomyces sp. NPDC058417]|uniref:VOC family protein n=1 Tax=unclassified Streptomyces TaxID=2593676 RepID=UPI0036647EBC